MDFKHFVEWNENVKAKRNTKMIRKWKKRNIKIVKSCFLNTKLDFEVLLKNEKGRSRKNEKKE